MRKSACTPYDSCDDQLAQWLAWCEAPWGRLRFAARVANDYLADDGPKHDPAYFDALLRLELTHCDREPFRRLGGAWQLVATRFT